MVKKKEITTIGLNKKPNRKRKSYAEKMAEKKIKLRKQLWPEIEDSMIWNRKLQDGFTTIPRTMPYFHKIMDELSEKGKPVSNTYFALWCRAFDEYVLEIKSENEMAFEAGFSGQRAVYTWRDRMKELMRQGFIKVAPGSAGEYNHVVLLDPYFVIKNCKDQISDQTYNAFIQRKIEIGAD